MKDLAPLISLETVSLLTNISKRTLWRRLSDGSLPRAAGVLPHNQVGVPIEAIHQWIGVPLTPEDHGLLRQADAGNTDAQTDLALIFLQYGKPEKAVYLLRLAAKHGNANAMHLLGRCLIGGRGVGTDEDMGIMWIARAATLGHLMAKALMKALRSPGAASR